MFWILGFGTLAVVVMTVLPLFSHRHWLVRGLNSPCLQIGSVALVLLILELALLDLNDVTSWLLISGAGLALAGQLWWIVPYTFLWPREVKRAKAADPSHTVSILTANVLTPNRNAPALINLVRQHQPDVLVTLEFDQWWQDQLEVLETEMPYSIKCPLDNLYGMHVFSRLQLAESECRYLVEDKVPSMHTLVKLRSGDDKMARELAQSEGVSKHDVPEPS